MTDLELTRLCAEAMGVTMLPEWTVCSYRDIRCEKMCMGTSKNCEPMMGECALAEMERRIGLDEGKIYGERYDPLHDDAQAMALVKKFRLTIIQGPPKPAASSWHVELHSNCDAWNENLNRAICECVSHMQQAKASP